MIMPAAIELRALKKTYKNGIEALKGINLTVDQGDFFALLGANGAGKSTTIGLMSSLLKKTSGQISICGYDLDTETTHAKQCIGLVPQEVNLNVFETCEHILLNQAGYYGITRREAKPKIENLLKKLELWSKRESIVRDLSGGMKRRLMIARALIHQPKVLILDEPSAGVDVELRRSIWAFLTEINQEGTTIILTTHYLEEAEQLCRNVAIIKDGEIIQNSPIKALLTTLQHQTYIFNTRFALDVLPDVGEHTITMIDPTTFEIHLNQQTSLNDIFALFSAQNIEIQSLRNKNNRLEALFLDLIHHDNP